MNISNRVLSTLVVAGLAAGTLFAAPTANAQSKQEVGADYYVFTYPGKGPNDAEGRVELTAEDYDTLAWYDQACVEQRKAQQPSAIKEVGADVVISAASSALGVGLGAKAAFGDAVSGTDYALYGAGAGGGGGLFSGLTGRGRSTRYVKGQCMNSMVTYGARIGDMNKGVFIALNPASVRGKPIKRSTLPSRPQDEDDKPSTTTTKDDADPATVPQ